jgi:hypothetical protein
VEVVRLVAGSSPSAGEMLAELLVERLGRVWTFLLSSCSRRGRQSYGPHALGNAQVTSGTDV